MKVKFSPNSLDFSRSPVAKHTSPFSFDGGPTSPISPLPSEGDPISQKDKAKEFKSKAAVSKNLFGDEVKNSPIKDLDHILNTSSESENLSGEKVKKSPKPKTYDTTGDDGFEDTLQGVTKRIEADLRGKRPLSGDEKRVHVGMGLYVNRKAWEKSLRTQKADSKFLKEFASIIWGREKLKARTGLRSTADKKPCTPKKVNLLNAILKGKMRARGECEKQQDFIIQNLAPKWLSEKCYDCGRPPKKSTTSS